MDAALQALRSGAATRDHYVDERPYLQEGKALTSAPHACATQVMPLGLTHDGSAAFKWGGRTSRLAACTILGAELAGMHGGCEGTGGAPLAGEGV